jgi:hypothetical protein
MREKIKLIFALTFIININLLFGQDFQILNNLPPTIEVKAPEFNTLKTYYFKVDSINNNLIVQDLRSSKKGDIHFYQWLYEIPLNKLNKDSFKVSKDFENKLQLVISSNNNSILSYMFQDGKVISISGVNNINLGNWNYSTNLSTIIKNDIETVTNNLPITTSDSEKSKNISREFKYNGNNVQAINAKMDTDLTIGNGYYLGQIGDINFKSKKIKKALKNQNINHNFPLPIIIYADKNGNIESIFIDNKPYEKFCQIDLSIFKQLKPLMFENNYVPAKYIFLLD